jgi:hypothetical protein
MTRVKLLCFARRIGIDAGDKGQLVGGDGKAVIGIYGELVAR